MPRYIRNFWITAAIDGRDSHFASGPRSKCGGFSVAIFQRDRGTIGQPLRVTGRYIDGRLIVLVDDAGTPVFRKETTR